jgi:hypothetical protein
LGRSVKFAEEHLMSIANEIATERTGTDRDGNKQPTL